MLMKSPHASVRDKDGASEVDTPSESEKFTAHLFYWNKIGLLVPTCLIMAIAATLVVGAMFIKGWVDTYSCIHRQKSVDIIVSPYL